MDDTVTRERTPEQLKAIGQRLKSAREALGLTQKQVCALLDTRPATWNHWETGRRLPDPLVMVELADSHRLSLDWVYSGRQTASNSSSEQMAAIGHRLRASRSALELSPQEMAGLLGIRTETLETWESGRALPDLKAMSVLAEKFGLSLDWLFRGDPSCLPYRLVKTLLKL
ncbi:MAG: helix-turn-helix transcriptional regulator [Magnetococcales bacterium]|nr:helix-turn-helix transcriptional regulator [Magnetococcales bacterium]